MSLQALYERVIFEKGYASDPAQLKIIAEMEKIAAPFFVKQEKKSWFKALFSKNEALEQVKGLYCYGGVGRGKTFLMDLLMDYLPTKRKKRLHFHRFMLEVHDGLQKIKEQENPIELLTSSMAKDLDILLLDEFFVSDITHAMILDRLLRMMQKYGIILVTTSNIAPVDLYKNGLQRERFLPAIAWIEENLTVHAVEDGEDFRKRHFSLEQVFRLGAGEKIREEVFQDLKELSGDHLQDREGALQLGSREVPYLARNRKGIAFLFSVLCQGNYSPKDYIEIAKEYEYIALCDVPVLTEDLEDAAKRFLLLIDELYDRRVKLLLVAEESVEMLYQGKRMRFEYERLQSRLFEMQSEAYWQEAHLA